MQVEIRALVDRLNMTCRKGLEGAAGLCLSKTHYNVELEHFLIKLIEDKNSDIHHILSPIMNSDSELESDELLKQLYVSLDKLPQGNTNTPSLSAHIFTLLEEAWVVSSILFKQSSLRSAAVLLALVDNDSLRGLMLESCPLLLRLSRQTCQRDLQELLHLLPENADASQEMRPTVEVMPSTPANALTAYTQDLTARAKRGELDPTCGRDQEIRQIIDILCRRRQNNPILVGEAGVGKTAIVEGLAQRIAESRVPPSLQNVTILMLDLIQLQAGASAKGQFEERINTVLQAINQADKPIIMFIDEAHTLIGAGGAAGLGDAANLLKPALARGELRTIAATTWGEYKRYFEKDPALTRRFELVKVKEPSHENAVGMLRSLVPKLAEHHGVALLDESIQAAVSLSKRYIVGQHLPDKAIRLLDTAAARACLAQTTEPEALQQLVGRQHLLQLEKTLLVTELPSQRLEQITREIEELQEIIVEQRDVWKSQQSSNQIPISVDKKSVARVVAEWTGVPLAIILKEQGEYTYATLMSAFQDRIIGQEQALSTIAKQVINYRAGLIDPRKPMGVFLLVGPSGVGKTETAQVLAEILTGKATSLLRFNMTEFQEPHSVATLKGSPPGYIGHGKGGTLTEAVRRNPYSVILLDEVDKAHREVMDLFYQVFDKGILEDAEGVEVDFTNTLILMTANLGSEVGDQPQDLMPILMRHFRSALLSRMTVVPYMPLHANEIAQIAKAKLQALRERILAHYGQEFAFNDDTVAFLVERASSDFMSGARAIDYWINQEILPELANFLLQQPKDSRLTQHIFLRIDAEGKWTPQSGIISQGSEIRNQVQ
ncbi:MAG: AAA family ATPase [Alphaproteobacteria bacterium]